MAENTPAPAGPSQRSVVELLRRLETGEVLGAPEARRLLGSAGEDLTAQIQRTSALVGRLRRRERELLALITSTHDLVDVHEVQAVLNRLVDRAHDLVGTDVTYMSVYDARTDELFVRAGRGTVSPRFLGLRVPAGVGIASRVVRTLAPHWVADYWDTSDFDHDPEIDRTIREERLRSLLGVPVSADGEILGVLFAADRSARSFGGEEIALLSAFADQAALILRTARLFSAAAEAAERAERHAEEMDTAARVHERLTALVLSGHGPREVAETLSGALGRPVAVADRDHVPLASSAAATESWWHGGRLLADAARAAEESRVSGRCAPVRGHGRDLAVVAAVVAGSDLLGLVLVGSGEAPLSDLEQRTIERSAQILALLTMRRDALTEAEDRVRGELALDLLSGSGDTDSLERRARARGFELHQPWTVVVLPVPDERRHTVLRALSGGRAWLAALQERGVAVLIPGEGAGERAEEVTHRARRARGGAMSVVGHAARPDAVPATATEAWDCALLLPGLGATEGVYDAEDHTPYLAMFGTDGERARRFARRLLGPVVEWDREHGTDLVDTLIAYLDNGAGVTRTSRALFVHANTVKQRLERLTALLGPEWRTPEHLFRLGVAARLHRLGVKRPG
ncbi:helix-turn-helix domain-containing protein [Nocardiopsis sp. MG754419]|uniref:helix-turn-helix domain-containing protein n=1 Tax=Nocardiopsis sp. MG754419 TaxID=2259865 RepID=UPI001BAB88B9|nr:helix-turn-helix domain-containing protein [Nocardiopsis sp. MG754419]MBR8742668.1 DNA-binding protein [Nocardiopsis sp. MG754419]